MKVYTKTGDLGTTSLVGGTRVSKTDSRLDAYGTIDELMAFTGHLYDSISDPEFRDPLIRILDRLMTASAIVAAEDLTIARLPTLSPIDVEYLEQQIDSMQQTLDPISNFTLPACGNPQVSMTHICRTVCRRAEREVLRAAAANDIPEIVPQYLNRLSDYYYVLGRKLAQKLNVHEILWYPKTN